MSFVHRTVLLNEAVEALAVKPAGIYVDCTFGRGGHSRLILSQLGAQGRLIAFDKEFLARRIGEGVTTLGIPIAIGLIVFTVLITAYYVWRANREFDRLTAEVLQEARQ